MEPFTLHCTTCRARLKVKDESVVGSILNCPRCGSMVHVAPPVDWPSSDGASAAALAPPGSATESSLTLSAAQVRVSADAAAKAAIPPKLPKTEDAAAQPPAAVGAVGIASDGVNSDSSAAVEHDSASGSSSAMTWLRGDGLVWAGGLAAGVVVGAATWFVVTGATGPPAERPVAMTPAKVARPEVESREAPVAPTEDAGREVATRPPAAATAPMEEAPHALASAPENESAASGAVAAGEASPPADAPIGESVVEAPPVGAADDAILDAASESVAPREPSLKLDPAGAPAALVANEAVVESILGPAAVEPSAADATDEEPVAEKPASAADEVAALTQEDVDSALAVRLGEVKFVAAPLAQFVEFIADASALAISVDDAALAKAGKKRTMPLSVHLNDTTAREALQAAIAPLGLACELRGNRLFVTVPSDAGGAAAIRAAGPGGAAK